MPLLSAYLALAVLGLQTPATTTDLPDDYVGAWRLEIPQALRDMNQKIGVPDHSVRINVTKDSKFDFVWVVGSVTLKSAGKCELRDGKLRLQADEKLPVLGIDLLLAELADGALTINGGTYRKVLVGDISGVWTLHTNGGKEDRSISVKFTADGKFSFTMSDAKSMGHYDIDGTTIKLTYEYVDGQKLETPFTKTLQLSEDGTTITVDGKFTYQRKGV